VRTRRFPFLIPLFLSLLPATAAAATRTVCASGCMYSDLQAAIDAAVPGDTLLLRAGETFHGNFTLPAKSGTSWITIRSDASDSQLPADGVRLVPSDRSGGNTSRSLLPRLVGLGGALITTPVVETKPGAHNYRLEFLEIDETLVQLGDGSAATPPSDIILDRDYLHGHPTKGMKRGVSLNGVRCDVINSYIADIKAVNADSQGIAGWNGAGPFKIINNYIEAGAENILFGGSDPGVANLIPSDITVSRNYLTRPIAWRNPIMATPASVSASATTGGSLTAGAHYFRVVAVLYTDSVSAVSVPSKEVSATTVASGAVRVSWAGVSGADNYRIYHGTAAGAESRYVEIAASSTAYTYTGSAEKSGSPPTTGTPWVVKNNFELKNAQRVTVDGNVMENTWLAGQYGYAVVLTPRNSENRAPWSTVKDVTITNNIIRHAAGVFNIANRDDVYPSGPTTNVSVRNNLFYDIDNYTYGGGAKAILIGGGPTPVTFDHNTFVHVNSSFLYAYGPYTMNSFTFTNNLTRHFEYGIMGENTSPGNLTIQTFFPGSNITCNAIAGANPKVYPTKNAYPTVDAWTASFANFAGGDYRVVSTSAIYTPGCIDPIPGADVDKVNAAAREPWRSVQCSCRRVRHGQRVRIDRSRRVDRIVPMGVGRRRSRQSRGSRFEQHHRKRMGPQQHERRGRRGGADEPRPRRAEDRPALGIAFQLCRVHGECRRWSPISALDPHARGRRLLRQRFAVGPVQRRGRCQRQRRRSHRNDIRSGHRARGGQRRGCERLGME
jgi:hypothetical protein